MSPLPLPLPLLLQQAFDGNHLCLTVPWLVEYLSMMDKMAPQLNVYSSLLDRLHFIQRYAWESLYKTGHSSAGLLVASCVSWLFEVCEKKENLHFSCVLEFKQCDSYFVGNFLLTIHQGCI